MTIAIRLSARRVAAARRSAELGKRQKTLYLSSSDEEELARLTGQLGEQLKKSAPAGLTWHSERMLGERRGPSYHPAGLAALGWLFKSGPSTPPRR